MPAAHVLEAQTLSVKGTQTLRAGRARLRRNTIVEEGRMTREHVVTETWTEAQNASCKHAIEKLEESVVKIDKPLDLRVMSLLLVASNVVKSMGHRRGVEGERVGWSKVCGWWVCWSGGWAGWARCVHTKRCSGPLGLGGGDM